MVEARPANGLFYLRLGLGALVLVLLFRMLDRDKLLATLAAVNAPVVFLGLLVMLLNLLLKTYRWALVLHEHAPAVSFKRLVRLNFASMFLGNFLPTSLSHDFVRIFYIARGSGDPRGAISSIIADRVIGNLSVAAAAVLAFMALHVTGMLPLAPLLSYGVLVFLLASLALPLIVVKAGAMGFVGRLLNRIAGRGLFDNVKDFSEHLIAYRTRARLMGAALILAFVNVATAAIEFYLIARSLSTAPALHYFFLFIPLVILFSMLPVSVGGLGLLEASLAFFFSSLGLPLEAAIGVALLHRALQLICLLPGGALYVWKGVPSLAG